MNMRKILLLIISIVTFSTLQGQITLTNKTHGFHTGDSHDFILAKNSVIGNSGASVIWDFSGIEYTEKTLTSHMLVAETLDKSKEIGNTNLVLEEFGNQFFFNCTNNLMEQYGAVTCNVVTKYDKPFVKLKFPLTYSNKFAGKYSGVQESPNSKIAIYGNYEIFADGYGTLLLPGNIVIENVLRVKQTRTINYNNGGTSTEITYRWYSDDVRYPLLTIIQYVNGTQSTIAETAVYAHAGTHKKSATSVAASELISSIDLYPNPYDAQLTISYNLEKAGKVSINLYDVSGKLFKNVLKGSIQTAGLQSITLNSSDNGFKPGVYYVRISIDNSSFTRKVVKI